MPNSVEPLLLLVEDNADDVELARRALRTSGTGVRLEIAGSVAAALEVLKSSTQLPRAVFIDLNMPEKNGFDFLQIVRANKRTEMLPVVVLTTSNRPSDVERCYKLGANGFVTKPIDFVEFTEVFAAMSQYWLKFNRAPV